MPTVKGGVWTNIEDEILKASVSKYGLNQWARVSSLLARKTAKQCKSRWSEWLDPSIRKIEWSKDEDERLLHLAKLMPTQWRTIAPIVGRTPTQCLERYQKLLDEAEQRENNELGLSGPSGGEAAAPSADDVRRLRPGELDPDPESKPARPDTIDLDEDEKEMLSEARARLANTQGKKAKRKARERQLEESRRLAVLQKRRELKNAGINIKVVTRKPGQMDYNADIPFEKAPAPGFYDTAEEEVRNERQREMFDPRKQQLANKRKGDQEDESDDRKRRKNEKNAPSAAFAAAAKAGQMQKIREAERSSKRKSLNLPAPQVSEGELEDIVKMGMAGERASQSAGANENQATRGLVGNYSSIVNNTPIRTPRAPQEEDRIANEIRNARARTEAQSALLGGESDPRLDEEASTGYKSAIPTKQEIATPNPMATPFRQANGVQSTPRGGPDATPMRTPRDNFKLNDQTPRLPGGQTPREVKLEQAAARNSIRGKLAALPRPKETEWDFDIQEDQQESTAQAGVEDASVRDERNARLRLAQERENFKRESQVLQRSLPLPAQIDLNAMLKKANTIKDPSERTVAIEAAKLIANDVKKLRSNGKGQVDADIEDFSSDQLERARMEIALDMESSRRKKNGDEHFDDAWFSVHESGSGISGMALYTSSSDDEAEVNHEQRVLTEAFQNMQTRLTDLASSCSATEKRLAVHLGGYQARSRALRQKIIEASETIENNRRAIHTNRVIAVNEDAAIQSRLEGLREEVAAAMRRERTAQENYRELKEELQVLQEAAVNGNSTVNGNY